ncbi:MAG: non-canonical purine NTP pyrophosphatase, RdgB/HAM1 family [Candidatus Omnitrophota bacterium]|nr:MAG: non-canonical purine NTP pyrophosphatase, RdgB/HAM1 family [Candidatus Omnitrophota bacterium]RKY44118.1 MAG: non-canonical purine NTP pyrophosphatase, RdgB/HAM1 family [Candidatus Omnitrophota bacterium]
MAKKRQLLIVATANKKKFKEIKAILGDLPLQIKSLLDFKKKPKIIEEGKTFLENAEKKAEITSSFYNCLSLGEDSGLEVEALKGRPGVFSSRFAGKNATDRENIEKLLTELKGLPKYKRKAKFISQVVLACKGKILASFKGSLTGFITFQPQGRFGFGYDPVFFLPEYKKTTAQLKPSLKNKISHRYKALSKLKKFLKNYLELTS